MGDDVDERNRATAERIAALGARLSDAELSREIDPPWTAAGLFAHIAFWDRFVLERWRLGAERGERLPMAVDDDLMYRINDASLDQWMSTPPRAAVALCVAAADEVDSFLRTLDASVRDELIADGRPRLRERALHRGDHLRTIED